MTIIIAYPENVLKLQAQVTKNMGVLGSRQLNV